MDRREAFRSMGRLLVGGLLAGGGAVLAWRNRGAVPVKDGFAKACGLPSDCGGCGWISGCGLPPAREYKQRGAPGEIGSRGR